MGLFQLNPEQQAALDGSIRFIDEKDKHREEYLTISGKAGSGKTVVGAQLVDSLPQRRFIVAAISHKAKEVIASRIHGRNVKAMTIASLLAMKFNEETGEFYEDPYENDLPIADADIVIIDEASMIHQKTVQYIFQKKMTRTVVIFMGDIGQIRPIKKNAKLGEVSPIFNTPNFFQLLTRVRQGEGNPILSHMDYFWDMTRNPKPNLRLEDILKEDEENEIGAIRYRNNMYEVIEQYLHYFKEAIDTQNTNILKIICYKNDVRHFLNDLVRKGIYGEQEAEENQYFIGELMIMGDTYNNEFNKVENSTEFAVTAFTPSTEEVGDYTFRTFELVGVTQSISGDRHTVRMTVLDKRDQDKFDRLVSKLFAQAAEAKGVDRKYAYREAWGVKNLFAKADYGYAMTSHKAQGSTYDRVIVNLTDMLNSYVNDQEKASLIYTAGTRARFEVVMVNRNFVI
jgi:hypothetical protein